MHSNGLMQLPDGLTRLTGLRVLAVAGNRLMALPGALLSGGLPELRCLDIGYNSIARLPPAISGLSALRRLRAARNRLAAAPAAALAALSHLEELSLAGNPLAAAGGSAEGVGVAGAGAAGASAYSFDARGRGEVLALIARLPDSGEVAGGAGSGARQSVVSSDGSSGGDTARSAAALPALPAVAAV